MALAGRWGGQHAYLQLGHDSCLKSHSLTQPPQNMWPQGTRLWAATMNSRQIWHSNWLSSAFSTAEPAASGTLAADGGPAAAAGEAFEVRGALGVGATGLLSLTSAGSSSSLSNTCTS